MLCFTSRNKTIACVLLIYVITYLTWSRISIHAALKSNDNHFRYICFEFGSVGDKVNLVVAVVFYPVQFVDETIFGTMGPYTAFPLRELS